MAADGIDFMRWAPLLRLLALLLLTVGGPALAQTPGGSPAQAHLELYSSLADLRQRIADTAAALSTEEAPQNRRRLESELEDLLVQEEATLRSFREVAAGTSLASLPDSRSTGSRDLASEVQQVILPLVEALGRATEKPRRMETLRAELASLRQRLDGLTLALERVSALAEAAASDPAMRAELVSTTERLTMLEQETRVRMGSLRAELDRLEAETVTASTRLRSVTQAFVRGKGRSALEAMVGALGIAFLLLIIRRHLLAARFLQSEELAWIRKPLGVMYGFLVATCAYVAAMFVVYMRGDILLFNLGLLSLILFGWAGRQVVPRVLRQVRLVLNLGSVREGERLLYDGLPWRVERLGVLTTLVNPDLQGGSLHVVADELLDQHSAPEVPSEAWFPTRVGEWVVLDDGTYGQVVVQTPRQVVVESRGILPKTYATLSFLAQNPRNLSRGFWVWLQVSLPGEIQDILPNQAVKLLEEGLRTRLAPRLEADEGGPPGIRKLRVRQAESTVHALRLALLLHCEGSIASEYEAIQSELQGAFVDVCNEHGWRIPLLQIGMGDPASPVAVG